MGGSGGKGARALEGLEVVMTLGVPALNLAGGSSSRRRPQTARHLAALGRGRGPGPQPLPSHGLNRRHESLATQAAGRCAQASTAHNLRCRPVPHVL